jgi:hypothetical protein
MGDSDGWVWAACDAAGCVSAPEQLSAPRNLMHGF